MLPAKKNHKIWSGATFRYEFQYFTVTNGIKSPKNLTGYTGSLTIDDLVTDANLLTLTDTSGGIIFGGTSGLVTILIPSSVTSALTWEQGKYQLLVTGPGSGDTDPLLYGRFTVLSS